MKLDPDNLRQLVHTIFTAVGSETREADIIAEHLVDACLSGHDSHGVIRVLPYVKAVTQGQLTPNRRPTVQFETDTIVLLDGNNGYGQVAAFEATEIGIAMAKRSGLAMVTLRNCGHVGRMGAWAERAAAAGQATIYFVNSVRRGGATLAPFGGTDRRLNAGPICLGMPVTEGEPVVLDISTSSVAMGKVRLARNMNTRLREACIIDAQGNLTDDPNALYGPPPGAVLPFGTHKGYGFCVFTDLFGGILSGAGADYSGEPCEWYPTNNMVAIHMDLATFTDIDSVSDQVRAYADWVKASPPQNPDGEVLMPGEAESKSRRQRKDQGIEVDDTTWGQVMQACDLAGVPNETVTTILNGQQKAS